MCPRKRKQLRSRKILIRKYANFGAQLMAHLARVVAFVL